MCGEKNMCGEGGSCGSMGGGSCGAGSCGGKWGHHCGKIHLLKKVVMLLVLLVVFWFGTKFGELKSMMRYSYGQSFTSENGDYGYGYRMMGNWNKLYTDGTAKAPATGTQTPVKQ